MTKDKNLNGKRIATPKWHRVYYLLAVFDVVVVIFGLYLNHQIISIQNASIVENQTWSKRLENYLQLNELAANVNAPGNNVFDTEDYVDESRKFEEALNSFNKNLVTHYQSLEKDIPIEFKEKLRPKFDKINRSMDEMTNEARSIFSYFEQKRADAAGRRMAEMDRKYFQLNGSLSELRQTVLEIQQTLLNRQAEQASFLRQLEIISGIFILIMVGGALFYGNKIREKMEVSAHEKEAFIGELQTAHQLLKKSQDELEQKVEERTLQLSESKDFVENIFSSMADMLLAIDDKGFIEKANPSTLNLLGYQAEEIIGKQVNILTQKETFLTEEEFEFMLNNRELIEVEKEFVRKNGEKFNVLISSSLIHGKKAAAVVVAKDITKLKKDEQRLKEYTNKLQQSNRELEDFAYVASHDLQEPLRKIQAFGDRLHKKYSESLSDEGREYIRRMGEAASRMQRLINDLLTFSRITTKAKPFETVDVKKITNEVISDLEVRIEETKGNVEIGELPKVDADPVQIRQLMQNLIGNALKFSQPGQSPKIKVYSQSFSDKSASFIMDGQNIETKSSADTMCQIIVQDNGIGFDEKYLDRIFTVFQRLHGRTEYEGSGVGLAVCRKIVERHRGTITAESKEGQGSTFLITLPINQTQEETIKDERL